MRTSSIRVYCKSGCLAVLLLALSAGCAQIRLVTYPASFTWLEGDDVRSSMHVMASSLGLINRLVESEDIPGDNREQILGELDTLEATAQSLSAGGPAPDDGASAHTTNHLLIDEHMDDFMESVLLAQIQAQADPPNYYRIGQLTGSCSACHRFR